LLQACAEASLSVAAFRMFQQFRAIGNPGGKQLRNYQIYQINGILNFVFPR